MRRTYTQLVTTMLATHRPALLLLTVAGRYLQMRLTYKQLATMLDHADSPRTRWVTGGTGDRLCRCAAADPFLEGERL